MKKTHLLILAICLASALFGGCQISEEKIDTPEVAENSVYGAWIDDANQAFFQLNDDNTYFVGGEEYGATSGGAAVVDDKTITLKPEYVIIDKVRQSVPESGGTEMVWYYSFTSNKNMVIKTNDYSFKFKRNEETSK